MNRLTSASPLAYIRQCLVWEDPVARGLKTWTSLSHGFYFLISIRDCSHLSRSLIHIGHQALYPFNLLLFFAFVSFGRAPLGSIPDPSLLCHIPSHPAALDGPL
ncbi:hypothetical protein HRR90_006407 [Exophiala dermatitidis]|uniref:Uncharacterized protein n=1 Tax=Exophiala dermatitidis TaxID=5970 RepID=A0AAN6IXP7_EXODE|nr:hypothetical protein HRR76_007162 [Exophiala dermatitidis]KAJ4594696.1 hypothetical protein HRR84_005970 [Exophiala dermatitidis]KAJ4623248.1 hypothetical protein HRR85_000120 [Exophiala dermatitidis]KAJ4625692.1 hypothetical protein HRR88_004385 [Exophiala dermatitidis]KAJ4640157.1 hypothetical protein HRR89_004395 [Exophiala dermatitidis]